MSCWDEPDERETRSSGGHPSAKLLLTGYTYENVTNILGRKYQNSILPIFTVLVL